MIILTFDSTMARTISTRKSVKGRGSTKNPGSTNRGSNRNHGKIQKATGLQQEATKNYRKNRKFNQWTEQAMESAIAEFRSAANSSQESQQNLRTIARAWNVPKSTLQRRICGKVVGHNYQSGRKPLMSQEAEAELASVIKMLAGRGFPLGAREVRRLAAQYSAANNLNLFQKDSAGYYWFRGFLERHKELRIKRPEALSAARAIGMNRVVIRKWFEDYEALLQNLGITDVPSHIWNADETGMQDHFERQRAIGVAGAPCYQLTANEKGQTVTALACFNGVGSYAPLLFIFKAKRLQASWCIGAPADSIVKVSDNGWITASLFAEWAERFVAYLPKDDIRPHVLLLDGHSSHIYNMPFLQLMKENNIHPFAFPPHCTHWLQPADKSLFKSVKHNWNEDGWQMTKESGGAGLSKTDFFKLFSRVWAKSATVEIAQNGFRSTGLFPLNSKAIPDSAFSPSMTTDRAMVPDEPASEVGLSTFYSTVLIAYLNNSLLIVSHTFMPRAID